MPLEHESDEWLMGQVARGRRECLEVLIRRYSRPITTYCRRFLGDQDQADEAVQEVFLRLWTKRRQYRLPASFRSWLYAITANQCRELHRKRRPDAGSPMIESREPLDTHDGPVSLALRQEQAVEVKQALSILTEQQRAVLVMRVWNNLSYAEIALALHAKESAVRGLMHRALARLRPALDALQNS